MIFRLIRKLIFSALLLVVGFAAGWSNARGLW